MSDIFVKTEAQKKWLDKLKEKEADFKRTAAVIDEQARFPKENIQSLVDLGYTKTTLPTQYGGEGLGVYDLVLFQERLASYDPNTSLSIGWSLGVVGDIFEKQLWDQDKLDFFAKEVSNGAIVNRAVSEVQTGSPTRGGRPGTSAVKKNGSWIISGRKSFSTASPALTYFLTSAWIEEKQKVGFFLLHKDLDGLTIDETWDVISMRGTGSHDLVLDEVVVGHDKLVELPDQPRGGPFNGWLLHIPATYLGIAKAARDYAINFANHHQPNSLNHPISELPNVQQLLGEIDLALTQARHLTYSVASFYDDPSQEHVLSNELAVVKHTVTNTAIQIVDKAMRIVGAKSLQRSNPLQRYYRDVRAGLHNPPMDDMTIKALATAAIKNAKEND